MRSFAAFLYVDSTNTKLIYRVEISLINYIISKIWNFITRLYRQMCFPSVAPGNPKLTFTLLFSRRSRPLIEKSITYKTGARTTFSNIYHSDLSKLCGPVRIKRVVNNLIVNHTIK